MIELIPAIMPKSYEDLQEKVGFVSNKVLSVQFDIMDGKFVPEATWPYLPKQKLEKIIIDDTFELDLMVKNASDRLSEWIQTGAHRLIFHIGAEENLLQNIEKFKKDLRGIEIGLAVDLETTMDEIELLLPSIDFIQFMGIRKVGHQGEPFAEEALEKIKEFKSLYPNFMVSVDGGVHLGTVKALVEAGVNRLVVGSAIFEGNVEKNIEDFKEILS